LTKQPKSATMDSQEWFFSIVVCIMQNRPADATEFIADIDLW